MVKTNREKMREEAEKEALRQQQEELTTPEKKKKKGEIEDALDYVIKVREEKEIKNKMTILTIPDVRNVDWTKVKRVFIGTLLECEPCHSSKFIDIVKEIGEKALTNGFILIVSCCSAADDSGMAEAEREANKSGTWGWPYIRVHYKDKRKFKVFTGMPIE